MHRANLLAIEERKANGEVLATEDVLRVWVGYLTHVKMVVRHSPLPEAKKIEILAQLKEIPISEYFNALTVASEDE